MYPYQELVLDIVAASADLLAGLVAAVAAVAEAQATFGELEAYSLRVLMVAVRREMAAAREEAVQAAAAVERDAVELALDPPGHIASHKTVPVTLALETVVAVLRLPLSHTLHD